MFSIPLFSEDKIFEQNDARVIRCFYFYLNIASNSRRQIIIPIGIVIILSFLYLVFRNLKISDYIAPVKLLVFGILAFAFLTMLSNMSLAMLYTRKIRSDVSKLELFEKTLETVQNESLMKRLRAMKDGEQEELNSLQCRLD